MGAAAAAACHNDCSSRSARADDHGNAKCAYEGSSAHVACRRCKRPTAESKSSDKAHDFLCVEPKGAGKQGIRCSTSTTLYGVAISLEAQRVLP